MGSDSEEERWHTLDSIKEESSEEEEEDGERMDTSEDPSLRLSTELCHPLPAQTSSEVPFDGEDKQNNLVIHLFFVFFCTLQLSIQTCFCNVCITDFILCLPTALLHSGVPGVLGRTAGPRRLFR